MTESLRQHNASNRANELTEENLATALNMMKKLEPRYAENPVILAGILDSLAQIYSAELVANTPHK